ncbi:MAG: T9SS type A sorting domain-containing protein [Bacteroidetes bacterium]|nr:T9SS type A sorting domain-containing protein [Bacteroidota bacterium]
MDQNRIGWWSSGINPQWGWKFYANGRTSNDLTTAGWWSREFHWNYAAVVDLTGDRAPSINSFTTISSGPDTGPFTVDANITDDNPSGGAAGVASATLMWTNDGGTTWNPVAMTGAEPDYSGDIPAQSPNTDVSYFIDAADVNSNTVSSITKSFFVFGPSGASTLVIFNGPTPIDGYPQDYYWGLDIFLGTNSFDHDRWAYGELPLAVANSYTDIIEITTLGPNVPYNDAAIRAWLAADGSHNYFLAGQEWLGQRYAFNDMDFAAGTFEFDILGINHSYNDVSFVSATPTGHLIPSLVMPIAGTRFGGPLSDLFNALDPAADSMMYNPGFELGTINNWIDAYDVEADVEVDMNVETRGIGGLADVQVLPTMSHRTLPGGNKIVYVAYDPLSLNTANDNSFPYYEWIGFDVANSPYQAAFNWFGILTGVIEVGGAVPEEYSISQNYPNPFNPSTTIKFSIPEQSNVVLKVYDILGSEVANLVNETLDAGNYTVNFDASQFASGMYIYKITAGNFVTTKKMMLLK